MKLPFKSQRDVFSSTVRPSQTSRDAVPIAWTRRDFLHASIGIGIGIGATALSSSALAIGPRSDIGIGHLRQGPTWDHRPEALRRLLWETGKRTSIQVARDATVVVPDDIELFYQPLLVWTGSGETPPMSMAIRNRLARHLRFGGMLWIDAPSPTDPFALAARDELTRLFPKEGLLPLPTDHVLFRSYFLLDKVLGRNDAQKEAHAILLAERLAVLVTECDVLGAYERDRFGTWRFDCAPGGDEQREQAFRFGVNVVMYATCLDYKADQVHIPFIMKKTRR